MSNTLCNIGNVVDVLIKDFFVTSKGAKEPKTFAPGKPSQLVANLFISKINKKFSILTSSQNQIQ
jgi:hypothetical protein